MRSVILTAAIVLVVSAIQFDGISYSRRHHRPERKRVLFFIYANGIMYVDCRHHSNRTGDG